MTSKGSIEPSEQPQSIRHFWRFPIACFSLALLTDVAYSQTVNLQWLHFSEWLLLAGLVFGALELLALIFDMLFRKVRPSSGCLCWAALSS